MAERTLTSVDAPARGWTRLPVAARIGVLYVAARLVTTGFFVLAASLSGPASRFGDDATIASLAAGWDAQWYWYTAVNGYPADLPLTADGRVGENPWAFMPIYAYLALFVGVPLRSWMAGAVVVSLVAGYLACLVLYRMLRMRLDATASTWAVLLFASGPLAALFQVGYAEALFLLWLFTALLCVMRRRYGWLWLLVALMAFTRPGVLAFALMLGLYGLWRLSRRRGETLGVAEGVHIGLLAAWAAVLGFSWQVLAAVVTGRPSAYLDTELSWRRNWIVDADAAFAPFDGFLQAAAFWFPFWGWDVWVGYAALVASVVLIAALLAFEPHVKRLGIEIRLWTASYLLYLLAVFFPQSSLFRLLMPISPLWGAVAAPASVPWRVGVLVAGLAGQWWWIYNMYGLGNTLWQIP